MAVGSWFPRLSPSGRHVAAGNIDLRAWLDGAPVEGPPTFERPGLMRSVWLDDDTILANAHNGSGIYRVPIRHPGAAERIDQRGANRLTAGKGWWAGWRPDIGIYVSDGTIIADGRLPAIDGPSLAYVRDRVDGTQQLILNQTAIWEGAVLDVWLRDGVLLWRTGVNRLMRWTLAVGVKDVVVDSARAEFWGVPLDGYILSHDDDRLMLRRGRETRGWIVHEGVTDEPDARLMGRYCRIVWSANGVASERTIDIDSPMVDLRRPAPVWHPQGTSPDGLLKFILPDQNGLIKRAADGQTLQDWITPTRLDEVKWGESWALERWGIRADQVTLVYDATDGKYPRAWRLAPDNLWCRTDWVVGDHAEFPANTLIRRTEAGSSTREPFPYAVGLEAYGEHVDMGGDCGLCTVIVLWFSPHWPKSGEVEKNWYAIRERDGVSLGRVRFELWRQGRLVVQTNFTSLVQSPSVLPASPLHIPDPEKESLMKPPNEFGPFEYPRQITDKAPWRFDYTDPENDFQVKIEGNHGERARITVRAGQHTASRVTADRIFVRSSVPVEPPPTEPPVEPPDWTEERVRDIKGNFLALPGHGYTFMYPGFSAEKRAAIRAQMKVDGLTHIPFGIWGSYSGQPTFDYRDTPQAFIDILNECYADGICPIVFLHTDRISGPRWLENDVARFWENYLPIIRPHVKAAALGWEFDQIDGEAVISGYTQLRLIERAKSLIPHMVLYGHWGPGRWAGGPDRAGAYTRDEYAWWAEARAAGMTGCLYNDNNPSLSAALDRLLSIPAPHGFRPGIAGRLAGMGIQCVAFELSRGDLDRWKAVRQAVEGHRDVRGWG